MLPTILKACENDESHKFTVYENKRKADCFILKLKIQYQQLYGRHSPSIFVTTFAQWLLQFLVMTP